jgi:hypothetical protein
MRRDKSLCQRMRGKIGPGHPRRIALRQGIDRLEPTPPQGIRGQGAVLHRRIERIEPLARLGPAGSELRRSAVIKVFVQALPLFVSILGPASAENYP